LFYLYIGLVLKINPESVKILYYFTGYASCFLLEYYFSKYDIKLIAMILIFILMLPLPILNKVLG